MTIGKKFCERQELALCDSVESCHHFPTCSRHLSAPDLDGEKEADRQDRRKRIRGRIWVETPTPRRKADNRTAMEYRATACTGANSEARLEVWVTWNERSRIRPEHQPGNLPGLTSALRIGGLVASAKSSTLILRESIRDKIPSRTRCLNRQSWNQIRRT